MYMYMFSLHNICSIYVFPTINKLKKLYLKSNCNKANDQQTVKFPNSFYNLGLGHYLFSVECFVVSCAASWKKWACHRRYIYLVW